ncbi:hypothetical protein [Leptospira interrogans]|uniref:hypothetical protein n=1 Tax=Leptospira interrogans TaxID=173 RepID=UPI0009E342D9|nr:hypothetical protein [Leptospira interrogans]
MSLKNSEGIGAKSAPDSPKFYYTEFIKLELFKNESSISVFWKRSIEALPLSTTLLLKCKLLNSISVLSF